MLFVWNTSVERSPRLSKDLAYYVSLIDVLIACINRQAVANYTPLPPPSPCHTQLTANTVSVYLAYGNGDSQHTHRRGP